MNHESNLGSAMFETFEFGYKWRTIKKAVAKATRLTSNYICKYLTTEVRSGMGIGKCFRNRFNVTFSRALGGSTGIL